MCVRGEGGEPPSTHGNGRERPQKPRKGPSEAILGPGRENGRPGKKRGPERPKNGSRPIQGAKARQRPGKWGLMGVGGRSPGKNPPLREKNPPAGEKMGRRGKKYPRGVSKVGGGSPVLFFLGRSRSGRASPLPRTPLAQGSRGRGPREGEGGFAFRVRKPPGKGGGLRREYVTCSFCRSFPFG